MEKDNVIPIRPRADRIERTRKGIERTCKGMVPPDLLQPTAPMPRLRLVPSTTPEERPTSGA